MKYTLIICLALALSLTAASCKIGRFVVYNFADITDYKIFPSRTIEAPEQSFQFYQPTEIERIVDSITVTKDNGRKSHLPFEEYLEQNKTVAFLIIQNDTLKYERYFAGYDDESIVASFSMAKSVQSMLVGMAIEDGLIGSINDPIVNYLPYLGDNDLSGVTIQHLLNMTSGIDFNESYTNPFGQAAAFYYGRNLRREVDKRKPAHPPGTHFSYSSGDSQLLGLVLDSALGEETLSDYLERKLWQPLGMEFPATWSLDKKKEGMEKTFCCLNARARDFAKLGRLYLNDGNWQGEQLVPQNWVAESTKIDSTAGSAWFYQNQWWLPARDGSFQAQGILGQYIYVNPAANVIIVRLGKAQGKTSNWRSLFAAIAGKLNEEEDEVN